jgi:hypothetical protein
MWTNPFRSEAGAFRVVLVTVGAFATVAFALVVGGVVAALSVWAFVSVVAVVLFAYRRKPPRTLRTAPAHVGAPDEHRVIVLAQAPPPVDSLVEIGRAADRVVVVSATSASRLHHWTSDIDAAREQAGRCVAETVDLLRAAHIDAAGVVGDADPLRAIEDALREFGGDEIVVATGRGPGDAAIAGRVRRRFALPVTHVVA